MILTYDQKTALAERGHKNKTIGKLRAIESKLAAIVNDSPNRHTLQSLIGAYDMKTGGSLMSEMEDAHGTLPQLHRRYGDPASMAYTLAGQSLNGQDWKF